MKPTLHEYYSPNRALISFGEDIAYEEFCDGQFFVLPQDVICFITVGNSDETSHFCSPSSLIWKPQRLDYDPSDDKFPWLPKAVREVWHPKTRKKLKEHHIFVRANIEDAFFYAGTAHLGSYGGNLGKGEVTADFSLFEKLPRDKWLQLGGYSGWLVEVNHTTHYLGKDDLAKFNNLLDQLRHQEFSHLAVTRYEEDSLNVYTNKNRRGWLMYLREPGDYGVYVYNTEYEGIQNIEEIFECTCGISLEFPINQTVTLEDAIEASKQFFVTGKLPDSVPWELD